MASSGNTPLLGRGRLILPDGQIGSCFTCLPVQPHLQKYFCFRLTRIKSISIASRPTEGRIAIVTNAGRDAVDAAALSARRDGRAGFGL
jgi:hypothetical protein